MFQVVWLQSALDELADIWVDADVATRRAVTAAAQAIDSELQRSPHDVGESRADNERIFFAQPLGVLFEIHEQQSLVLLLHVWASGVSCLTRSGVFGIRD